MMRRSLTLLVLLLLALQQPDARAGTCMGGERAKLRYLFERLGHLTKAGMQDARLQADSLVSRLAHYLPHFSLWWLRVETRMSLSEWFESASRDTDKPFDVNELRALVTSFRDRAVMIHGHFLGQQLDTQALLDETVVNLAKGWAVCRSIRTAEREPCLQIKSLGPTIDQNCISLMLRFGILYPGRCSLGKHEELMAQLLGQTPEKAKTICEILKNRQGDHCRPVMSSPLMVQICLAVTGQGEAACSHASLSVDAQKECLHNVYDYEVANRRRSLTAWEQLTTPDPMLLAAAMSARKAGTCVDVIMRLYDRLDKSAEDLFFRSEQWYQPPGIP